jgi:glycosyltransferase involved in cell wall biosynthesis
MTSHPNLSVAAIIPLYNGARWIEQALASVLAQTLQPDELLVVDDGSTDDGAGIVIVERMARQHPIIRLLRKHNGGQSSARNFGVANSSSAFIAFLDQDDAWYPRHLETLLEPFRATYSVPLGWVYSNLDLVAEDGHVLSYNFLRHLPIEHPKRHLTRCLNEDMHILPSASLISRAAFENVGGFDERLSGYEDDDLFLRMFSANYNNIFIDEALSRWRMVANSSSHSPPMFMSAMTYMDKLLRNYPDDESGGHRYARDFIVPRFYNHIVNRFYPELFRLPQHRRQVVAALRRIAPLLPRRVRTPLQLVIPLMLSELGGRVILAAKPNVGRVYRLIFTLVRSVHALGFRAKTSIRNAAEAIARQISSNPSARHAASGKCLTQATNQPAIDDPA